MTARDVVFPTGRQALYDKNRYSPAIRANGVTWSYGFAFEIKVVAKLRS